MMDANKKLSTNAVNTGQGRDLLNQLLGQAQALSAAGDFLRTFGVSKIAAVKEGKLYQQLSGMHAPDGSELKGTWQEFCGLLGMSVDKADEDIKNIRVFGENALEMMTRVGIGYRELRQFRRLPEDEQKALIEIAATNDKDSLIDFAEAVIARHAKEKDLVQKELEDLSKANKDLVTQVNTAANNLKEASKREKARSADRAGSEVPGVMADLRSEIAALVKKAELAITALYPVGVEVVNLSGHGEAHEWVKPTLRQGLSGLVMLRELLDGSIKNYAEAMGESAQRLRSPPDVLAFLDESEITEVAKDWARLTAVHKHEADLRKHERDSAKPRGKGRPPKAPTLEGNHATEMTHGCTAQTPPRRKANG